MKQKGTFAAVRTPVMAKKKRYAYDPGKKKSNIDLICRYCNAVYEEKHWRRFEELNPAHIERFRKSVCPSCHESMNHVSDGVLHVQGSFIKDHLTEIERTILNCEAKETERDILNRIERMESAPSGITVYTAKNRLAVEIGKKLDRAHKGGKLEIRWSKDDKPVDVTWQKDV